MLDQLFTILKSEDKRIEMGKMMSCSAITYNGKVFCFIYNDQMVFKLGKDFDMMEFGVATFEHLNPFKKKGPMLAWYVIAKTYEDRYEALARQALDTMIKE